MFLTPYYSENDQGWSINRQQASHFAKKIAGDFNPIHDEDNKRFCVPGDLLFSLVLAKAGISQHMVFEFGGMVSDDSPLHIETVSDSEMQLKDNDNKTYLTVKHQGDVTHDQGLIDHITKNYVQFSGKNFPHIMVPLMQAHQTMINTQRPLVIYESMELNLLRLDLNDPSVELTDSIMDVDGKRGSVTLHFAFKEGDEVVGMGKKRMVMSGLRPYNQDDIDELVTRFTQLKSAFNEQHLIAEVA